jgi:hypothetical protein
LLFLNEFMLEPLLSGFQDVDKVSFFPTYKSRLQDEFYCIVTRGHTPYEAQDNMKTDRYRHSAETREKNT